MSYPKILIIGQSFNKKNGGGVTISNLFTGWPKDKIAVASNANLSSELDTSVCNTYYQLGYNNKLHPYPLSVILPKIKCGVLQTSSNVVAETGESRVKSGKYKMIYQVLLAVLNFFGVYHVFYKLKITPEFAAWLKDYDPDIIYTQLASLELIRFVDDMQTHTKKPVAIHIMDDWPLTINKPGILYNYWQNVIDKEFRALMDKTAILMSISDAMSEEYKKRYGKNFIPFHNPIDISYWKPVKQKDYAIKNTFTILYAGRIGFGIESSIAAIAEAVNSIAKTNKNVVFEIQTAETEALHKLVKLNDNIKWIKPLAYAALPEKFAKADLLLLPQDFDAKSVQFLKYSFPTKVSEYMISGTPILVYGDERTGLTKYALKEKWAYVVTENSIAALTSAIKKLISDDQLRKQLAETAQRIAVAKEDAVIVKENFRKAFILENNLNRMAF